MHWGKGDCLQSRTPSFGESIFSSATELPLDFSYPDKTHFFLIEKVDLTCIFFSFGEIQNIISEYNFFFLKI